MSASAESASPLAALARAQDALPGGPGWAAWRARALERLLALGLPTPRDDAWKYTNLRVLGRRTLAPAAPRPLGTAVLDVLPPVAGPRLVFVDGRFHPALSASSLPAGVTLTPFAALIEREPPAVLGPALTGPDPSAIDDRIRLLNACLAVDGAVLSVAPGTAVAGVLQIIYIATGGGAYPRTQLTLGAGSALELIEYHVAADDAEAFVALASDLSLGPGAHLTHSCFQLAGARTVLLDDANVTLAADACYRHRLVALGGQLARLDLRVALAGHGASAELAGLFLADGSREHHVRTLVEHRTPGTRSDQSYRGVANDRARGSYDGKVIVHPGAAGSESRQSSRNLLLGREAAIDTRPQLQIEADDVKCSHGATTGALDEQVLFYLLTRGLDRDTARALLTYAFLGEVLGRLAPEALRRAVEARVLGRLPAAALIREFVA